MNTLLVGLFGHFQDLLGACTYTQSAAFTALNGYYRFSSQNFASSKTVLKILSLNKFLYNKI
jgi:hypothetical protein